MAAAPAAAATGVRTAIDLMRSRDPELLGAVAWWAFDIAVLVAMLMVRFREGVSGRELARRLEP